LPPNCAEVAQNGGAAEGALPGGASAQLGARTTFLSITASAAYRRLQWASAMFTTDGASVAAVSICLPPSHLHEKRGHVPSRAAQFPRAFPHTPYAPTHIDVGNSAP